MLSHRQGVSQMSHFDVENLSRELPDRLDDLIEKDGDRINK